MLWKVLVNPWVTWMQHHSGSCKWKTYTVWMMLLRGFVFWFQSGWIMASAPRHSAVYSSVGMFGCQYTCKDFIVLWSWCSTLLSVTKKRDLDFLTRLLLQDVLTKSISCKHRSQAHWCWRDIVQRDGRYGPILPDMIIFLVKVSWCEPYCENDGNHMCLV